MSACLHRTHFSSLHGVNFDLTNSPPSLMSAVGVGFGASAEVVGADFGALTFSPPVVWGLARSSAKAGLVRVVARSIPSPKICKPADNQF